MVSIMRLNTNPISVTRGTDRTRARSTRSTLSGRKSTTLSSKSPRLRADQRGEVHEDPPAQVIAPIDPDLEGWRTSFSTPTP